MKTFSKENVLNIRNFFLSKVFGTHASVQEIEFKHPSEMIDYKDLDENEVDYILQQAENLVLHTRDVMANLDKKAQYYISIILASLAGMYTLFDIKNVSPSIIETLSVISILISLFFCFLSNKINLKGGIGFRPENLGNTDILEYQNKTKAMKYASIQYYSGIIKLHVQTIREKADLLQKSQKFVIISFAFFLLALVLRVM